MGRVSWRLMMIGVMTDLMVKCVGSIGRRVVAELLVGLGFRV